MSVAAREPVTAEQLLHWPDPDARLELVDGVVRRSSPASGGHGSIGVRCAVLLGTYVLAHRLGEVFGADTGFVLRRRPDTVRAPDVAFVATERLGPGSVSMHAFVEGAPDLAVEVRSPSDRERGSRAKVAEYLAAGARAVWVVDPPRRRVVVHEPAAPPRVLDEADEVDGGVAVPGFRCPVSALFEGLRGG